MSGLLYPALPGLTLNVVRAYDWNNGKQAALSGKESTLALRAYPLVHFELEYEVLQDNVTPSELKAIVGLYNQLQGGFDSFLFNDPEFNTIAVSAPQTFGTSTGSTSTRYQLVAYYQNTGGPGGPEMVQNLNGTPVLYDNGSSISGTHYTIDATGGVTFTISPTTGHTLTWSGSFYYRCRFETDDIPWTKFMNKLWQARKVAFKSIFL